CPPTGTNPFPNYQIQNELSHPGFSSSRTDGGGGAGSGVFGVHPGSGKPASRGRPDGGPRPRPCGDEPIAETSNRPQGLGHGRRNGAPPRWGAGPEDIAPATQPRPPERGHEPRTRPVPVGVAPNEANTANGGGAGRGNR